MTSRLPIRMAIAGAMLASALSSGCAQISHHPVASFAKPQGIPYYLGSWYLLVNTDGQGGLKSQLFYMMDPRRRMEARPRAWLASLDSLLKMDGGTLTRADTTVDTTAVPTAILKAAEKVASLIADDPGGPSGIPAPSIFRVDVTPPTTATEAAKVTFVGKLSTFTVDVF